MSERRHLTRSHPPPCTLCHFCRRAFEVRGVPHGGYCLWFDLEILEDDLDDSQAPLRRACLTNGNHFVWRLDQTDPLALVSWKKSLFDQQRTGRHRVITLAISLLALFLSLINAGARVWSMTV